MSFLYYFINNSKPLFLGGDHFISGGVLEDFFVAENLFRFRANPNNFFARYLRRNYLFQI